MKTHLYKLIKYLAPGVIALSLGMNYASAGAGYPSTPAIVQVPLTGQHDSVGFNIVKELPAILYKRIIDGEITVYTTPLKDVIRTPQAFAEMEEQTKTSFLKVEDLFLDEDWKLQGKKFEFHIRGIYCLNRSEEGIQVNYGYINLEDIKGLLKSVIIPTNSNGPKNLTFWDALHSRLYDFNLLKFGGENFTREPERSIEIRNQAFFNPKVTTNAIQLPAAKEVELVVNRVDFNNDKMNSMLFEAVEGYFKQNPQEFFNLGGADFEDHTNPGVAINLTKIVLTETWRKSDNGISYQVDKLVFYINDHPLQSVNSDELEKLGFLVNFQRMEDFLEEKNFFFTITRINNQQIYGYRSQDALNALLAGSWNRIIITSDNKSKED